MRVKKITNTSSGVISVRLKGGTIVNIPPKISICNVDIVDEKSISGSADIVYDLTEVNEISGKQRLDD